jgi:hypothetical protein
MKVTKLVLTLLLSLLFSIGIPAALLYILGYISVGAGSGGAFNLPDLPQALLCFGFGVFALPFIMGTLVVGLPSTALMEALGLPILSDMVVPVRHRALTIVGDTETAGIVGVIVQISVWVLIFYSVGRLRSDALLD